MARKLGRAGGMSTRRGILIAVAVTLAGGVLVASNAVGFPTPAPFSGWSAQPFRTVFDTHGDANAVNHTYTTPDQARSRLTPPTACSPATPAARYS